MIVTGIRVRKSNIRPAPPQVLQGRPETINVDRPRQLRCPGSTVTLARLKLLRDH